MAQKHNLTIQVVSIIGGILTAIFFLGFLALARILRSDISCLIAGSILILTTLTISRMVVRSFLDAMNITLYIAGCVLIGFGINASINLLFITLMGISILTFLLSRGFILPFLSIILFNISFFGEAAHVFSSFYPLQIANACAALNLSLKELTVDCGVDILSFGGTKNGLMMGECVIVFNKDLQPEARFIRKQSAQLASKMRYLSCQFTAYLTDNLWLKNANHANAMAAKLYTELKKLPEVTFTQKAESNQLFLTMPRPVIDRMLESYFFYFWNEERNEIRLVTSFDTTEEDVDEFIRLLKR